MPKEGEKPLGRQCGRLIWIRIDAPFKPREHENRSVSRIAGKTGHNCPDDRRKLAITRPFVSHVTGQKGKRLARTTKRLCQTNDNLAAEARKHGHIHVGLLGLALVSVSLLAAEPRIEKTK